MIALVRAGARSRAGPSVEHQQSGGPISTKAAVAATISRSGLGASRPVGKASTSAANGMNARFAEDGADGGDDLVVRVSERVEEPEVADGGEVHAGAVLGPAPQRDQAGGDERGPGGQASAVVALVPQ